MKYVHQGWFQGWLIKQFNDVSQYFESPYLPFSWLYLHGPKMVTVAPNVFMWHTMQQKKRRGGGIFPRNYQPTSSWEPLARLDYRPPQASCCLWPATLPTPLYSWPKAQQTLTLPSCQQWTLFFKISWIPLFACISLYCTSCMKFFVCLFIFCYIKIYFRLRLQTILLSHQR